MTFPPLQLAQIDLSVLTCHWTPINKSINQSTNQPINRNDMLGISTCSLFSLQGLIKFKINPRHCLYIFSCPADSLIANNIRDSANSFLLHAAQYKFHLLANKVWLCYSHAEKGVSWVFWRYRDLLVTVRSRCTVFRAFQMWRNASWPAMISNVLCWSHVTVK